ncbi:Gti1/Pac2 family-domain-containing protein, partial [Blyttiomyces helicus]
METSHGYISTPNDALLLFEACRLNKLKRVQRRLSESERIAFVKSGACFVWDEEESGIKRWTDGRHWSPSRINGSFLIYREVEPRRSKIDLPPGTPEPPIEYVMKEGGLTKKAISITTSTNRRQHLVSYYTREDVNSHVLPTPLQIPLFMDLQIDPSIYPE